MKRLIPILLMFFSMQAYSQSATVIAEKANLRGTPTENGKVTDKLGRDTQVEVIKQNGGWFLVQTDENVGWIHGNTIKLVGSPDISSTSIPAATPLSTQRSITESVPSRSTVTSEPDQPRRSSASSQYILGPRGGCYYINSKGKKTYVDHGLCN